MRQPTLVLACALGIAVSVQDAYSPARYQAGMVPALPALVVGGGQVILELSVNRDGRVTAVTPLRTTPPFTKLLVDAVGNWQFIPAEEPAAPARAGQRESRIAIPSKVVVAAIYRPPVMNAPTHGESPRDVAVASNENAFPVTMLVPPFPPPAVGSGIILLEARVDRDGGVAGATVIRSAPPFDDAARAAVKEWRFRPARVRGIPVSTFAYVLFGFPVPVSSAPELPRDGRHEVRGDIVFGRVPQLCQNGG